jgi:hypothetical protein
MERQPGGVLGVGSWLTTNEATTTGSGHGVGMWGARGFLKFSVSSPIIFFFFGALHDCRHPFFFWEMCIVIDRRITRSLTHSRCEWVG